jgi:hypothetical protein
VFGLQALTERGVLGDEEVVVVIPERLQVQQLANVPAT